MPVNLEDTTKGGAAKLLQAPEERVEAKPIELLGRDAIPTLNIVLHRDALNGFNVELVTTNFAFSPSHAGGPYFAEEGHVHLFLDDVLVARVYGPWHHLRDLSPGTHTIRASLHANTHAPYLFEGQVIGDTELVEVVTE